MGCHISGNESAKENIHIGTIMDSYSMVHAAQHGSAFNGLTGIFSDANAVCKHNERKVSNSKGPQSKPKG